MRIEGLKLVICHRPVKILRDHPDLDVFACHFLGDIAGVGICRKDVIVSKIEIRRMIRGQICLIGHCMRIEMNHLVCPVILILRQTVFAVV